METREGGWSKDRGVRVLHREPAPEHTLRLSTGVALLTRKLVFAEGLLWMGLLFS